MMQNQREISYSRGAGHYFKCILALLAVGILLTIGMEALARGIGFDKPELSGFGYIAECNGDTSHSYTLYDNHPITDKVKQLKLHKFEQRKGYSCSVNVIDGAEVVCLRISTQLIRQGIKRLQQDDDCLQFKFTRSDKSTDCQSITRAELRAILANLSGNKTSNVMLFFGRNPQPFIKKADEKRAVIVLARNYMALLIRELSLNTSENYIKVSNPDNPHQFFITSMAELTEINEQITKNGADVAVIEKPVYSRGNVIIEKLLSWIVGTTQLSIVAAQVGLGYFLIVLAAAILYWSLKPRR